MALADSLPVSKLISSNFPVLTNWKDCNGSDCLRNNDAISLYIPQDNSTNDGQPPLLLLLSNNPSGTNNQRNRNPQKLSGLYTGIKVLGRGSPEPGAQPDTSYHQHHSPTSSVNHGEYGMKPIPPFAGGAELTDFIQPLDSTLQTQRNYDNIMPNHIPTATTYGGRNKRILSSTENRGTYDAYHSAPLIPFSSKLDGYPGAALSSPSNYSTYARQNSNYPKALSVYRSEYDNTRSVLFLNFSFHFKYTVPNLSSSY